ncbi:DoxX family protein [Taibaiella chishuiensis]|uniref:DoxX-like protein n=1 Tax=Taibaiella chishuiensis TaxID=1434707 RepID=A0A2P8DAH4_9BACT|nr:DoxX family protein [Taibaiella chishuiensis]PSK94226.1 DoxX-like protein [Taibaiella chishuiensis]
MSYMEKRPVVLNGVLWTVQVLLALLFTWAAAMKLLKPAAGLALMWPWTAAHRGLVLFTGCLDLLAAIGLVLPAALRIRPVLTVYAAWGACVLMVAAIVFHLLRGEAAGTGVNIIVALMSVFVAWGRGRKIRL